MPPVLRAVPKPHPRVIAPLEKRFTPRPSPPVTLPVFTDIGEVGYAKGAHGEDTSELRSFTSVVARIPAVGSIAAKAISLVTDIGAGFAELISAGNAAGLSPQQLDTISAAVKKGGAGSAGSVLSIVEGRAGTKQLYDPDAPSGYRTIGGKISTRFLDGG